MDSQERLAGFTPRKKILLACIALILLGTVIFSLVLRVNDLFLSAIITEVWACALIVVVNMIQQ